MRTLFIQCSSGAAGDMITAALSGLIDDRDAFKERIDSLGLPGVSFSLTHGKSHMIGGILCDVKLDGHGEEEDGPESRSLCDHGHEHEECCHHSHEHGEESHHHGHEHEECCHHSHEHGEESRHHGHENDEECHHHGHEQAEEHDHHGHDHAGNHHHHTAYRDVKALIGSLDIPERVKNNALSIYGEIAGAESRVHGTGISDIHFHEVGTADAVCDVVSSCLLFDMIGADRIVVSPVCTGFGTVKTAHGILPVPAPATAEILKGVPVYAGQTEGELCTPTGAAILKFFADEFGEMPHMTFDRTGTGLGHKDTGSANVLRVFLGEENAADRDVVTVYQCTVDDMTGESLAFAASEIRKAGALEVFETPVYMKKERPGVLITVLCREEAESAVERAIFMHTGTIGVRKERQERLVMEREEITENTPLGAVRYKVSKGFGTERRKPEYEDLSEIALKNGMSLDEVRRIVKNGRK
ncbi:MAG: nickel pincer cofactor biosynthesis protein LarC [Lachnospiraceae bacterium]|nr:nickel pincer cofactor biosynthesis protein LarC [Lachnospiraceae bacterium]